jgi:hypothetical protein
MKHWGDEAKALGAFNAFFGTVIYLYTRPR